MLNKEHSTVAQLDDRLQPEAAECIEIGRAAEPRG